MGRSLWFTEAEWEQVQRRMELTGIRSFSAFARRAILGRELSVTVGTVDPRALRAELARIGNNLNQIARHANTEGHITAAEAAQARRLMVEVQRVITQASAPRSGAEE